MDGTVLIVDNDPQAGELRRLFLRNGYHVATAQNGFEAMAEFVENGPFEMVITELDMPIMDGWELIKKLKGLDPKIPVVIWTRQNSVENAVQALRLGVTDFLSKPLQDTQGLLGTVERILEHRRRETGKSLLEFPSVPGLSKSRKVNLNLNEGLMNTMGKSAKMMQIYDLISRIAQTDCTVLILGETGTGKEIIAQAIHHNSYRRKGPFITCSCSAFSEGLLESELFGHEKGAFTGAIRQKVGRFEQSHKGTIFLDEIGEISPSTQIKLLHVLQERNFERVGGERTIEVDIRVIAATNRDLEKAVAEKAFREDLYYRINVMPIYLAPLRERREDIPLLAMNFLRRYASSNDKHATGFTPTSLELLSHYDWPGNVRELENVVERSVILARGPVIGEENLPANLRSFTGLSKSSTSLYENEKHLIVQVLEQTNWNKHAAARQLGISRSSLYYKLRKYEIQFPARTSFAMGRG
ncbi:MAG: sigma-54-dependent Fis family transcriptional regulator [Acidobacteria bacterium]|nr:sigma-54-dependent Fis family transcriptional regulator [Acidobacteriota bacterium]